MVFLGELLIRARVRVRAGCRLRGAGAISLASSCTPAALASSSGICWNCWSMAARRAMSSACMNLALSNDCSADARRPAIESWLMDTGVGGIDSVSAASVSGEKMPSLSYERSASSQA